MNKLSWYRHEGGFPEWIHTKPQMQNYLENIFNDPKIEKLTIGNSIVYIDRKHSIYDILVSEFHVKSIH